MSSGRHAKLALSHHHHPGLPRPLGCGGQALLDSDFFYADYGVTALEGGIVANSDWLAKNGDLAKGFLRATAKVWQMTLADPGAAIDAAHKAKPELKRDRDVHLKQLKLSFDLLATANTKGLPLGKMSDRD